MTEESIEPDVPPDPKPEPLKLDEPDYDYVEHGDDRENYETRDVKPGESK